MLLAYIMFDKFPIFHSERLTFRSLQSTDLEDVFYFRTDKIVNKYIKIDAPKNLNDVEKFIEKINNGFSKGDTIYWIICLKNTSKMIGSICLWNFSKDRKTAEVGYVLHPNYHKKGIMTEAMLQTLQYAFNTLQVKNVEAFTHRKNENSIKMLKKNGYELLDQRKDEHNSNNLIFRVSSEIEKA